MNMDGIEVIEIKQDVTEKSRKTLINNDFFKQVIIKNYWDSHGKEVPWEDENGKQIITFKNVKVLLEKVTRVYHFEHSGDTEFVDYEATINGEKFKDITSCKGTTDRLVLKACIGAG